MSNTALGAMKSLEFAGKEHENSESKINECKGIFRRADLLL